MHTLGRKLKRRKLQLGLAWTNPCGQCSLKLSIEHCTSASRYLVRAFLGFLEQLNLALEPRLLTQHLGEDILMLRRRDACRLRRVCVGTKATVVRTFSLAVFAPFVLSNSVVLRWQLACAFAHARATSPNIAAGLVVQLVRATQPTSFAGKDTAAHRSTAPMTRTLYAKGAGSNAHTARKGNAQV